MKEPSKIEKVGGGLPTGLASAGIAAFDGGILASFLPVLTSSLAAGRHEKRVREWFVEIESLLKDQEEKIKQLSDEQYKLINYAAIASLSTTEKQKLEYLKNVISKALNVNEVRSFESEVIGRWLRDISASEIVFIIDNFSYERVEISNKPSNRNYRSVPDNSDDASIISGLVSLGILIPSGPNQDTLGTYSFSNVNAKFISYVTNKT